ncbi:hypothetical protein [Aurantiacibacter odishensis]|uniref:hypothetical protein n=1 Tax=Aurantiacibacter odishensis TaxID=1155476 RepID=UPI000E76F7EC|nr:hypothetical protein [Aurantiacibacter odishensis]
MRAALIAIPQPGEGPSPKVAGKTIAHRQLLFAREAGCKSVTAFGNGASPEGIELRHAAERMGLKYHVISSAHALPGIIRDDDSLMVLQPGLLPESRVALELLRAEGDRILVVSAGPGASAGFERVDLDRAWAGSMTVPGHLLGKLADLPEDIAPHGALLRIALQHRLPEARLADDALDNGGWTLVSTPEAAAAQTLAWQRRHLRETSPARLSRWIARFLATGPTRRLLDLPYIRSGLLVLAGLMLGGGIASGLYERPVLGFALIALSVPVVEFFLALGALAVAPFGKLRHWPWLGYAVDAALLALGILAIDSLAHRSVFPPLVLGSALLLLDRRGLPAWLEPLRDRMVIGGFLAIVASLASPELAIMLAGLLVLFANIIPPRS